jgi:putative acetyltransferase
LADCRRACFEDWDAAVVNVTPPHFPEPQDRDIRDSSELCFGQSVGVIVRREAPADVRAARAVQVAAFGNHDADDEPVEARLLDALRDCDGWLPALSIVAEIDDAVVGHVVTTRAFIGDTPVLGLGPIGVLPERQGHGVGLTLMHATIGAAEALGEPLIALLGSPDYYRRFGFIASTTIGVIPPEASWDNHFQVRTLTTYHADIRGLFRYAKPFDEV